MILTVRNPVETRGLRSYGKKGIPQNVSLRPLHIFVKVWNTVSVNRKWKIIAIRFPKN